jgi:hypothetical protein
MLVLSVVYCLAVVRTGLDWAVYSLLLWERSRRVLRRYQNWDVYLDLESMNC